jgi:hypothetical protein
VGCGPTIGEMRRFAVAKQIAIIRLGETISRRQMEFA